MSDVYAKILLLAAAALYVTLVAFNNITDYGSNFAFVSHVLAMDTTFPDNAAMWRALPHSAIHHAAYVFIITMETVIAALCWLGCYRLWRARHDPDRFHRAKSVGIAALTLGIVLWFGGFVAVGGEWFLMWQSSVWNGVATAFNIASFLALLLIYLSRREHSA